MESLEIYFELCKDHWEFLKTHLEPVDTDAYWDRLKNQIGSIMAKYSGECRRYAKLILLETVGEIERLEKSGQAGDFSFYHRICNDHWKLIKHYAQHNPDVNEEAARTIEKYKLEFAKNIFTICQDERGKDLPEEKRAPAEQKLLPSQPSGSQSCRKKIQRKGRK